MLCNRREFIRKTAALAAVAAATPAVLASETFPGFRTITYNVYGAHGFAKTREAEPMLERAAGQIPMRLAMELALHQPDIITFQESPREHTVAFIAKELDMHYGFFPSGYQSKRKDSIGFPGAVISRFRISEVVNCPLSGKERPKDLFTRHWGRAVLESSGTKLVLYSAHLHPSDETVRAREIDMMIEEMRPHIESGAAILLQGDLNHAPGNPAYRRWQDAGFVDSWKKFSEGAELTFDSHEPYKRIDYVFAHGSLSGRVAGCKVLYQGNFRINHSDPSSFALSDHIPVLATFA
jgi:endonuclease/exonuclease/phosphatase family metal-dependent hydrolase